jgi:hypothetical protein
MHESLPDNISFGLDNPKDFEIAVEWPDLCLGSFSSKKKVPTHPRCNVDVRDHFWVPFDHRRRL